MAARFDDTCRAQVEKRKRTPRSLAAISSRHSCDVMLHIWLAALRSHPPRLEHAGIGQKIAPPEPSQSGGYYPLLVGTRVHLATLAPMQTRSLSA